MEEIGHAIEGFIGVKLLAGIKSVTINNLNLTSLSLELSKKDDSSTKIRRRLFFHWSVIFPILTRNELFPFFIGPSNTRFAETGLIPPCAV